MYAHSQFAVVLALELSFGAPTAFALITAVFMGGCGDKDRNAISALYLSLLLPDD